MMISFETAVQYLNLIRELEAKPEPLSPLEQKRLEMMKSAVKEVQDAHGSGYFVVVGTPVDFSDLDDCGDFIGK